jgi:hypothetical protein
MSDARIIKVNDKINIDEVSAQIAIETAKMGRISREISYLEEKITRVTQPSSNEGRTARCNAVKAAIASGNRKRAKELIFRFLDETGVDEALRKKLSDLLSET